MRRYLFALACLLTGCRQDMVNQPKHEALEASDFFPDGAASRPLPPHTVARGQLREDDLMFAGLVDGQAAKVFPQPVTPALLARGQERYTIYCAPCHGLTGEGAGIIVQRGFPRPPSFHEPRLREAPVGHYFQVITHGFGVMYAYAARVAPEDRWAITAYIRALQLSQNATLADAPPPERQKLEGLPR